MIFKRSNHINEFLVLVMFRIFDKQIILKAKRINYSKGIFRPSNNHVQLHRLWIV